MSFNKRLLGSSSVHAILLASAITSFLPSIAHAQASDTDASISSKTAKDKAAARKADDTTTSGTDTVTQEQAADIIVTGQRAALESASQMKRKSDTIGDSIVLDDANKVPSTSLLEVLQRVPGVTQNTIRAGNAGSPDGFAFEGSGIQVRGLSGIKSLVNGREVFSANGGNGLNLNDIGPELLKAVTVYKASRADLIEGGVAGTIDLQTYMPFDFNGPKIAGSVSGNYGDFSKSIAPSASFRASTRFDTGIGEFGILADIAYSKIKSYDSNILVLPYYPVKSNGSTVYVPAGFSETNDQFERTRKGFYGALQWRPIPELTFYHTTFVSRWDSNRNTQLLNLTAAPNIAVSSDSQFSNGFFTRGGILNGAAPTTGISVGSNASYTPSSTKTSDFSQGFNFESGRWKVSGSYQYVTATSDMSKYGIGLVGGNVIQTNIDTTTSRPGLSFQSPLVTTAANSKLGNFAWLTADNEGHSNAWQLDASYDLGDGFFKKLAVGGRIADRTETDNFVGTYWAATARGWNGVPQPNVAASPQGDFELEDFSNFFKGAIPAVGSVYIPSNAVLRGDQFTRVINTYAACAPNLPFRCTNPAASNYIYGNPPSPNLGSQPSFVTTHPTTKSAYAMIGFGNDRDAPMRISGNIGVRWVNYRVESEGNYVFTGNTNYYLTVADAQASLAQVGGLANVSAWQAANPGQKLPLTYTSVTYSANRSGSFEQDYLLPSFNLKFEPNRTLVLRYALTETLTPPNYNDVRAQGMASVFTNTNPLATGTATSVLPGIFAGYSYTSGNPSLKPATSINNDISIEWYPKAGVSAHISLFNKAISNQYLFNSFSANAGQFFSTADQPQSVPASGGAARFIDGPIVARGNVNAARKTIISGVEVGGRTYFDMLPGLLKGFGIDANLTYIDNKAPDSLALDMNGNPLRVPLVALSKWAYTTTLLYDLKGVSARMSWTWRSRYLATTSDASTSGTYTPVGSTQAVTFGLPVYGAAAGRLDGSIGYQFNDHFNMQLNVANITNTDQRTEMEILKDRFVQRGVFVTDRRISLNAGFNF
ncbi:TonB-dependent receptor [Sphingomonas sp.]|uniref:TonB-dependent receptor n=1 Tax=Sphingomonas sp. TaxID=28214 RepID=UPI0031DE42C6